jgi:hypothetical protein
LIGLQIIEQINGLTDGYVSLVPVEFTVESRVAVAEARGKFGNPEEIKRPPTEAVTKRLVKRTADREHYGTADREHYVRAIVNCKVCEN